MTKTRLALLSLFNKDGLNEFAAELDRLGFAFLSTGGTAKALRALGHEVRDVAELTGFPEIMDGRVKTLHPKVHGGLLGRGDLAHHREAMETHGIEAIDLLAVNLYPFRETLASGASFVEVVEMIDIGGPAMIRGAAKNHESVIVLTDPRDYPEALQALAGPGLSPEHRRRLAARAFAETAAYDSAVAAWLQAETGDAFPVRKTLSATHAAGLRYGENPHQSAALYLTDERVPGPAGAELISGKALSYNNLLDADAAYRIAADFHDDKEAVVAIIKHANPCGAARHARVEEAYRRARACDPTSAFGGIIACNQALDEAAAQAILELFVEVIVVPEASEAARTLIAAKPNVRLLVTGPVPPLARRQSMREVLGGLLVQDEDLAELDWSKAQVATRRQPSEAEWADLKFAWKLVRHVKSNALVFAKDGATRAIGAGQMSRLDSARIAKLKAEEAFESPTALEGTAMASDAFFPFPDTMEYAVHAGASAIIHPGGAMRDAEVIAKADELGIAMVLTGMRHFKH